MERYSKEYSSKWQSKYSEEFKRFVCNDYLTGSLTKREVEVKYNIGNSRLTYWLREKGYDYLKPAIMNLNVMQFLTKLSDAVMEIAAYDLGIIAYLEENDVLQESRDFILFQN